MRNIILLIIPTIILSLACIGSEAVSTVAPIVASTPTRTPPPMLPTATPDYRATAERAEYLVTQEIASVARGRLALDGTQAAHDMSMQELNAARAHELNRTLTAAEAFAIVSRAQVEASATAQAIALTQQNAQLVATATAQQMIITDIVIIGLRSTQTADAPLAYIRQRAQLTELSAQATLSTNVKAAEMSNASYWRTFWKIVGVAITGSVLLFVWVLALSIDSRRHERLINARAAAARQRIINGGTTFAGDTGAMPIPQGSRPIVDMSYRDNGAGWASAPVQETPQVDPMRGKAIKLLLDAAGVVGSGSNIIPSLDKLPGWNSDSERDEVIKWLAAQGAVFTRPGSGTFISAEFGDIRRLFEAVRG